MTERRRSTGSFEVERTTGSHEVLDRLFVYGTMRQGQTARSLIANQIARCVGARAVGSIYGFPMGYPGFVEGEGETIGEVIWLTELPATFALLDAYEGADFARVILQVTLDTGEAIWAWIYALADPKTVRLGTRIEHGDWVRYWTEQT
ncbi:MAG TPA: gamma-glutamylcyclotransferase family protein [Kofleriaceae bacterium]|jgi:gamma-glutamylcyclotransferase (GGCT)/AIG2-like uncharacterized protein YtfP|nr:gamma-glutamylcyclotransferase family protein [Kofleriaceae bacterium]